jgi:hypothetical protein
LPKAIVFEGEVESLDEILSLLIKNWSRFNFAQILCNFDFVGGKGKYPRETIHDPTTIFVSAFCRPLA